MHECAKANTFSYVRVSILVLLKTLFDVASSAHATANTPGTNSFNIGQEICSF